MKIRLKKTPWAVVILYLAWLIINLFSLFSAVAFYQWPTNLFQCRFETGDDNDWVGGMSTRGTWTYTTNVSGGVMFTNGWGYIVTNTPHSGNWCAMAVTTNSVLLGSTNVNLVGVAYLTSPRFTVANTNFSQTNVYGRTYFNIQSLNIGNGQTLTIQALVNAVNGPIMSTYLTISGGKLVLANTKIAGTGTTAFTSNVWHCVETYGNGVSMGDGLSNKWNIKVWLDGVQELTASNVLIPTSVNGGMLDYYRAGWMGGSSTNVYGTLLFDDVVVDTQYIGPETINLDVWTAPFDSRLGVPLLCIGVGASNGCKVVGTFGGNGYTNQFCSNALSGVYLARCKLTNLMSATYAFNLQLWDSNDVVLCQTNLTWVKSYDGNPLEGADEYNNFYAGGVLQFPITDFSNLTNDIVNWYPSNYINAFYGTSFYIDNPTNMLNRANLVSQFGQGLVGPTSAFADSGHTNLDDAHVANFLTVCGPSTNVWGFDWIDEPEVNHVTASQMYHWYLMAKTNSPSKFVHSNIGDEWYFSYNAPANTTLAKSFSFPFFTADVLSFDEYPYEWDNLTIYNMVTSCRNFTNWNFNLIPMMEYVAVTDVRTDHQKGMPTTNQMALQAWVCIANGAKGIHWYPFQGTLQASNYSVMQDVTTTMAKVKYPVLLGTNMSWVTETNNGTNILLSAKTYLGTNWLILCNLSTNPVTAYVVDTNLTAPQAINYYRGGTVSSSTGYFSDTVNPETAVVYEYILGQQGDPATPIIGIFPSSLSFLCRRVDSTSATFIVTNVGTGTLTGNATTSDPGYSVTSGGSYSLDAGQGQTVTVAFNPNGVAGSSSGTITLTGGGGATVGLSGTSTNFPIRSLSGKISTTGKVSF